MPKVLRWQKAFLHVSVCLSVSLFNGSWVGCRAFFSPYSQHRRRRLIRVCIQKVYLRGKRFIIHSLWNQWLIVFSFFFSAPPLSTLAPHFKHGPFLDCRFFLCAEAAKEGDGGGAEGEGSNSNGNSGKQRKCEHLQAAGLDVFPERVLLILHIGEKMGKRPAPEWSTHAQVMSHFGEKVLSLEPHTEHLLKGKHSHVREPNLKSKGSYMVPRVVLGNVIHWYWNFTLHKMHYIKYIIYTYPFL